MVLRELDTTRMSLEKIFQQV
uniref:Uncharacterized protein n=1 Tax=Haemonchus contortus TaxID=6289 RepID=A0A7I4XSC9_HAECO